MRILLFGPPSPAVQEFVRTPKCKKEHVNSNEALMGLYQENISETDYRIHLDNLLRPTYQAAKNQGFAEWNPAFIAGG